MAAKYHCPKCGKRYVEWGAKSLDYKCPDCEDGELVPMGLEGPAADKKKKKKKPSLKRKRKKAPPKAAPAVPADEADAAGGELDEENLGSDEAPLGDEGNGAPLDVAEEGGPKTGKAGKASS